MIFLRSSWPIFQKAKASGLYEMKKGGDRVIDSGVGYSVSPSKLLGGINTSALG